MMGAFEGMRNGRLPESPAQRRMRNSSNNLDTTSMAASNSFHDSCTSIKSGSPKAMDAHRQLFKTKRRRNNVYKRPKLWILVLDLFVCLFVLRLFWTYFASAAEEAPTSIIKEEPASPAVPIEVASAAAIPLLFDAALENAPECGAIEADEITFTLAIQLSENRLWMMKHHCELWGTVSPISVAVWTALTEDDIHKKLKGMGCHPDQLTVQTMSSVNQLDSIEYPINAMRNLALDGVETSHVLIMDVDFWESVELFDTLNSPRVRQALSEDEKLGIVVPAFQLRDKKYCQNSVECQKLGRQAMPVDFEELVLLLSSNKVLPYDPLNFSRQGSTGYRKWMKQGRGDLSEIPCVSSNQYQPYMAVRYCKTLPPFQERFEGHGRNNMAWMLHLRRLGYRFEQVGGSFMTHFPHARSPSRMKWEKSTKELHDKESLSRTAKGVSDAVSFSNSLRGKVDKEFLEFRQWLEISVPDNTRTQRCEEFEDDDANIAAS